MNKMFRAYWPSVRKHVAFGILAFVCMVINVYFGACVPYYIKQIVNIFTSATPDTAQAERLFWTLLCIFISSYICFRFFDYAIVLFEARVMKDLEIRSFAVLQKQALRFFENSFSGSLVKYTARFRNSFEGLTDLILMEMGRNIIMIIVTLVVFARTNASFAIAFAIWIVVFLGVSVIASLFKYPLDQESAESDTKIGGVLADSISNHTTVKSFGRERFEQQRFDAVVEENYQKRMRSWMMSNAIMAVLALLTATAELGLVWWMIQGWKKGTVNAGDFIFFQSYVLWVLGNLWSFGHSIRRLFQLCADAKEMVDIYALTPEVLDAAGAYPLHIQKGGIDFHAVSFKYGDSSEETFVLQDLSLTIPPGQSIGLVGKTGAGKSTIAKLLLRFYDINSGYISIDGHDIAAITQECLRQHIAVVHQNPQLFHRTVRENIVFTRPDATEEDIIDAAKKAHAWEFIEKLPLGLDTIVGERGVKLSGGQCQRIAIARAILADAEILILDEATSSLDSETEKHIKKATANVIRNRTSIVIAHRLSTLTHLDRIIVLEGGRIIEDGNHETLLRQRGCYANLWQHQVGGYII